MADVFGRHRRSGVPKQCLRIPDAGGVVGIGGAHRLQISELKLCFGNFCSFSCIFEAVAEQVGGLAFDLFLSLARDATRTARIACQL